MKIAYIAHPVGGDVENNLTLIREIVLKINLEEEDVVPFVPYYSDVVSMDVQTQNNGQEELKTTYIYFNFVMN